MLTLGVYHACSSPETGFPGDDSGRALPCGVGKQAVHTQKTSRAQRGRL